jgi:carboxymethylenebutenolidase
MIHGDFGLTDGVKEQAKRLAGRGYVVLAVDLYRGEAIPSLMDAHILSRGLPESRALGDVKAATDYLAGRDDVRGDALGVVGWDSGGGYALDAALKDPRLRAVVVCYGRVPTDAQTLAPLRASVLGIFAGADEGVSPQTIRQFRAAMEKAGKRVAGIHVYPRCDSGFLDPSAPSSARPPPADAVADAWRRIETYLDDELKR